MAYGKSIDILWSLDQLVNCLRPFALAAEADLVFESENNEIGISDFPQDLFTTLVTLIGRMISLATPGQSIKVRAGLCCDHKDPFLRVCLGYEGTPTSDFEWLLPVKEISKDKSLDASLPEQEKNFLLPVFYKEVRKHLQFHFSKPDILMHLLSPQNGKAAAFLGEVNKCIEANISDDKFDANSLSRLMHVSRIQLYRKLKPLIKQSPADYIRSLRLQRAKELLETTDLRVSEVAFQTGFQSPSHFTQVFIQNYGVRPSLFSRRTKRVTNG
jgi:AraC-like DNA-binding protein